MKPNFFAHGFDRLSVPPVEPEDPVGLRDRVPTFDGGQFAALRLTGLFSQRVVGWSMNTAMTAQLVTDALVDYV